MNLAVTLRNLFSKSQRIAGGEAGGLRIVTRGGDPDFARGAYEPPVQQLLASNLNAGDVFYDIDCGAPAWGRQGASTHLNRCRKALPRLSRALGPTGSTPSVCSPKRSVLSAHRPQVIYELDDARREGFSARPGRSRRLWHRWTMCNHSARFLRQWELARRACAGGPASETASIRRAEPSASTEVVFKHGHRPNDSRTMQCGGSAAAYESRVSQQDAS